MNIVDFFHKSKVNKKILCVCIGIFVWGAIMSFLVPTWQVPDEIAHLNFISEYIGNETMAEQLKENISIQRGRMEFKPEEKMDKQELITSMEEEPSYSYKEMLPKAVSLGVIKYLPSIIGMLIALLLGVPAYWVLQFGEIFSLLFYVFMCYKALRIMPIKKEVMVLIMALPMTLQQAGSVSYDAVLLPLCFYYTAYIFFLKFEKDTIVLTDFLRIIGLIGVITYIKMPYVLFVLLIMILPSEKISIHIGKLEINQQFIKQWGKWFIAVALICVVVISILFKDNRWIQIVYGSLVEWRRSIYLILQTIKVWYGFLITSLVGNFGWLDTPIATEYAMFVCVFIVCISLFNFEKPKKFVLNKKDYCIITLTGLGMTLLTMLSMINHTIMITLYGAEGIDATYEIRTALYQIPYIGGLQGRYFLPFVILFFILIPQVKQTNKNRVIVGIGVFESITFVYTIYVLLCRFWIG